MKTGITLYNFAPMCKTAEGLHEVLARLKQIGYSVVQVSSIPPEVTADEIAGMLKEFDLECCITHVAWNRYLEDIGGVVEDHKKWNCRHAALGMLPWEYYTPEGLERFLGELPSVAQALASEGLDFSYHNHAHELIRYKELGGSTWLDELYRRTSADELKAELDLHWLARGGVEPSDFVRRLAGRIPVLHFKDYQIHKDNEVRFAPPGEGNLNWQAIVEAARQGGCEYVVFEQDDPYETDRFELAETALANMQSLIAA
ncbi:MAG: sugar phosphate isomerase/epimerase [Verrucomicrobiota bacterium]